MEDKSSKNEHIQYAFRILHIDNIPHVLKYGLVHKDSPYASSIYVLHHLNGSYLSGVGQMEQKPFDCIWLTPDTVNAVKEFFSRDENKQYEKIFTDTASFLSGYYNYMLELLSTIDFILHNNADLVKWLEMDSQTVYNLVVQRINQWSERKKYLFNNEEYIRLVLNPFYKVEKQKLDYSYV